jgi:hypothetical protein
MSCLTRNITICTLQVPLEELLDDLAGLNLAEVDEAAAAAGLPASASADGVADDDGSQQDMEH